MASNLATIRVELVANAQKFKSNLDKGSQSLKKFQKQTSVSSKGNKKLQESMRNLSGSIAAVQGPLGPVAGRITSIGAIMGRVSIAGLALTAGLVAVGAAFVKLTPTRLNADKPISGSSNALPNCNAAVFIEPNPTSAKSCESVSASLNVSPVIDLKVSKTPAACLAP